MTHTLTRRRLVQLMAASTVAGAGSRFAGSRFAGKIVAQAADLVVLSVTAGPIPTTTAVPEVGTTEGDSAGVPSTGSLAVRVLVQSIDVTTGQVQTVPTPQALPHGAPVLNSIEAVTGFTTLADSTIVLAITPVSGSKYETAPTRLTLLRTPPMVLTVSGLAKGEELESVVADTEGGLLGLVTRKNGRPPARLATIDLVTGAISTVNRIHLPATWPFRSLTQCHDGTLYTTAVEKYGGTMLAHLDLGQKTPLALVRLTVGGMAWNNGLESLVCSRAGQLLAFGAPRYVTPNALYAVDRGSGAMTKLRTVDSAKVALSRA